MTNFNMRGCYWCANRKRLTCLKHKRTIVYKLLGLNRKLEVYELIPKIKAKNVKTHMHIGCMCEEFLEIPSNEKEKVEFT